MRLIYFWSIFLGTIIVHSARIMVKTFRPIDDISTLNSDDVFSQHVGDIYFASLTLNKENEVNDKANVLDLNVSICEGKFRVKVYDNR